VDGWLIFFRILHVGSAMMWFGGAIIGGFFLQPTAKAFGSAGQPFMDHLMKGRGLGIFFPVVAALAILSGAALYWHDSSGLQVAWITTPTGLAYTIGGLAALVAFVGGLVLIGPSIAEQAAVQSELDHSDGVMTADQDRRLARAEARMRLSSRLDLPLLVLAGLTMAVGRYLY